MTWTLKQPTVEVAVASSVRDGVNCPEWFTKAVFTGGIKINLDDIGTFLVNGTEASNNDVILLLPNGNFRVMVWEEFYRQYTQLPEATKG